MLVQLQTKPLDPLEFGASALATSNRGYYIYLTEACNIRCGYCFVSDKHNNRHLWDPVSYPKDAEAGKPDMAGKIIDFIVNDPDGRMSKYIHFFGGEPLIRAKSIERICREIKEKLAVVAPSCKITWGITTNGTLLTDENCQLLKKWDVGVQLSLDGSEEGNDVHRQLMGGDQKVKGAGHNFSDVEVSGGKKHGAFKLVKIQNYLKYFGNNARMTVTVDNLRFLTKSIREMKEFGFKSFSVIADTDSGSWDGHWEEYREEYTKLFELAMADPEITVNVVQQTMSTLLERKPAPEHLCQAGRNVIGISVDGDIYPCHDFLGKYSKDPQQAHDLQIGHVDRGWTLNTEKFSDVKCDSKVTSGAGYDCKTCHAQSICERGCPYINYASGGAVKLVNATYCRQTRINAEIALRVMFQHPDKYSIVNLKNDPKPGSNPSVEDLRTKVAIQLFDQQAPYGRGMDGRALLPGPATLAANGWEHLASREGVPAVSSFKPTPPAPAPTQGSALGGPYTATGFQIRQVKDLAARA